MWRHKGISGEWPQGWSRQHSRPRQQAKHDSHHVEGRESQLPVVRSLGQQSAGHPCCRGQSGSCLLAVTAFVLAVSAVSKTLLLGTCSSGQLSDQGETRHQQGHDHPCCRGQGGSCFPSVQHYVPAVRAISGPQVSCHAYIFNVIVLTVGTVSRACRLGKCSSKMERSR